MTDAPRPQNPSVYRSTLIPISKVARRLGVTLRALRHYQALDLVDSHRTPRNERAFDLHGVARLEAIVALRQAGLPISTIAYFVKTPSVGAREDKIRQALIRELEQTLDQAKRLQTLLDEGAERVLATKLDAAPPAPQAVRLSITERGVEIHP